MCPEPSSVPDPPIFPELQLDIEEELEQKALKSESFVGEIKFTARFTNDTDRNIDLIWKDYHGAEVLVRPEIAPGVTHEACTFLTHSFLARDSVTRELRSFNHQNVISVVFEGLSFGVSPLDDVQVHIFMV